MGYEEDGFVEIVTCTRPHETAIVRPGEVAAVTPHMGGSRVVLRSGESFLASDKPRIVRMQLGMNG